MQESQDKNALVAATKVIRTRLFETVGPCGRRSGERATMAVPLT